MGVFQIFKNLVCTGVFKIVDILRSASAPLRNRISDMKSQKRLILFIVCVALLLDNMLYMVIVPIITDYFKSGKASINSTLTPVSITAKDPHILAAHAEVKGKSTNHTTAQYNASFTFQPTSSNLIQYPDFTIVLLYETDDDVKTGFLFASKAIVQLMANPFTGTFIDRVGYVTPLTLGLAVMFVSTTLFACANGFGLLFLARSMQGLGSALADTASLGLIADRFQNEAERSRALGIALAFISFGSLVAPPFGGILYEFAGKEYPFLILSTICLLDAMLLLLVQIPASDENKAKNGNIPVGTPIYKLFIDPYITVIALSLAVANFPLAFLEPTIAKWMEDTMNATKWQIGLVWLPAFIPHVLGVYLTVKLSIKYFRYQWLYGAIGLIFIGVSTAVVPMCKTYGILIFPLAVLCFGIALIDTALLPTLAFLVDVRHTSVYGSVYAIADISYSIAYSFGPVLAGQTVHVVGYLKMNVGIGLLNVLFAPLLLILRKVYDWKPDREERQVLLNDTFTMLQLERSFDEFQENNESQPAFSIGVNGEVKQNSTDKTDYSGLLTATGKTASVFHKSNARKKRIQDEVLHTDMIPISRQRKPSLVKQHDFMLNTTSLKGDMFGNSNKLSRGMESVTQPPLNRGELRTLAESNMELHNPAFENSNCIVEN